MNSLFRVMTCLMVLLLSTHAQAEKVFLTDGWARATVPSQDTGMIDLTLTSKQDAVLVGISSPVAQSVEMHRMTQDNGMMKMRQIQTLELPDDISVNLREEGIHLMLIGLKAPLKAGDTIPLTLRIQMADKRIIEVEGEADVRTLTGKPVPKQHEHHSHGH